MRRYSGVHGRSRVESIVKAVEASGGRVLAAPHPGVAPFELDIALPDGSPVSLVCYAFTANKYRQEGRGDDEHRFQVKYGSDFDHAHPIYIDSKRRKVTLFFGVHEEEDLFIAADPAMHNPTWFSVSIEFKEEDLVTAKREGWHGWERDRVAGGRRRVHPRSDLRTESLLAFRPEHFLTYVQFERVASSLDAGERLMLIDKIGTDLHRGGPSVDLRAAVTGLVLPSVPEHALLQQFGLTADQLLEMVGQNFRLLAAIRGGVAEHHLNDALLKMRGISDVRKLDRDGEPDFEIVYRGSRVRIECKNVLRKLSRGVPRVDFQKTRAAKNDPCSRYYLSSQFEVLAACIHPITERWEFRYCLTRDLAPHNRCPKRLSDRVLVDGDHWTNRLTDVLARIS